MSTTDASDSNAEGSDEDICPICGQDYDHKRSENKHRKPELRSDAAVCKTPRSAARERTVYIHLNPGPRVVSGVRTGPSDDDKQTGGFMTDNRAGFLRGDN